VALAQQRLTGRREPDRAGVAVEQGDTQAALELLDRAGQRWLGDAEALGARPK
jgi:hypothetical protein